MSTATERSSSAESGLGLSDLPAALTLGDARIDDDHSELLALCHAVRDKRDQELSAAFTALQARFAEHFACEEALMAGHDFSTRQCHLDDHAAVLRSFDEVSELLRSGSPQAVHRMAEALAEWLPEHMDALDRHLVLTVFQRRTGGAPVLLRR